MGEDSDKTQRIIQTFTGSNVVIRANAKEKVRQSRSTTKESGNNAIVASCCVTKPGKAAVLEAVDRAMSLAGLESQVTGGTVFIKVNLMSSHVVPGTCTSPWVFEGVLKKLRKIHQNLKIFYGDADAYGVQRAREAARKWGLLDTARSYDAEFINLSYEPTNKKMLGPTLGYVDFPRILEELDILITIPVLKTHYLTVITCALKNQWGLLPTVRYKFHPSFQDSIAEINSAFKGRIFAVADLTIAQEGLGPRMGKPVELNAVLSSIDPVAIDSCACEIAGVDIADVPYLDKCRLSGLGSMQYQIKGDAIPQRQFARAKARESKMLGIRETFKKTPLLGEFLLSKPIYAFQAKLGKLYVDLWYASVGKNYLRYYSANSFYADEFKNLCSRIR